MPTARRLRQTLARSNSHGHSRSPSRFAVTRKGSRCVYRRVLDRENLIAQEESYRRSVRSASRNSGRHCAGAQRRIAVQIGRQLRSRRQHRSAWPTDIAKKQGQSSSSLPFVSHEGLAQSCMVEHNAGSRHPVFVKMGPNLKYEVQCGSSLLLVAAISVAPEHHRRRAQERANPSFKRTCLRHAA